MPATMMKWCIGGLVLFLTFHGSGTWANEVTDGGLRANGGVGQQQIKAESSKNEARDLRAAAHEMEPRDFATDYGKKPATSNVVTVGKKQKLSHHIKHSDAASSSTTTDATKPEKVSAKPAATSSMKSATTSSSVSASIKTAEPKPSTKSAVPSSKHHSESHGSDHGQGKDETAKVSRDVVVGKKQNLAPLQSSRPTKDLDLDESDSEELYDEGAETDEATVGSEKDQPTDVETKDTTTKETTTKDTSAEKDTPKTKSTDGSTQQAAALFHGYAPSICGTNQSDVEEICNTDLPICKYETEQSSGNKPFHITTRLRRNQGDCIRRCDKRYGLSEKHCLEGETCFTGLSSCTRCAILTRRGCEAF